MIRDVVAATLLRRSLIWIRNKWRKKSFTLRWHIDVPKACATSFRACNNHEIIVRQEDWYGTRSYAKISFLYSLLCWYNPFDLCTGYVLRFVKEVLFYPKKEVMAFPNINKTRLESAMFMFTLSLTRLFDFNNIVMWEPVKYLRIKLQTANRWCKQTHR